MTGRRQIKMQVRVSHSPIALPKQSKPKIPQRATKSRAQTLPSTLVTSPSVPQSNRPSNRHKDAFHRADHYGYARDDFIASGEDEEPVPDRRGRREAVDDFGPRITTDQGLAKLPEIHRVFIYQFVDEAKREVEKIRNSKNMKKPIFTEASLREMAVRWTTTLDEMRDIPGINLEAVDRWGPRILPLVKQYSDNYEKAMSQNDDVRDIDDNHRIEIVLSSDSEIGDEEIDDHGDDDDDDDDNDDDDEVSVEKDEEHEGSRYFQNPTVSAKGGRQLPWGKGSAKTSTSSKKSGRGEFPFKGKSRGARKASGRKSNGSTTSSTGIPKRKSSGSFKNGGPSKPRTSKLLNHSGLMRSFGNPGGGRGNGRTGGIGMMPP